MLALQMTLRSQKKFSLTKMIQLLGYMTREIWIELDMWSKSDGKKIYNLKKKINSMNLSNDASDIYKKILLTNTFPPKTIWIKKIFDLKAEWLIKNGDLDLIIDM